MGPRVPLPPEIQLAQRLAGNEQVTRDRAVKRLRKYIVARTQRAAGGFTHDELLKVWKGLFYCMWMQDKALLQEELGRTISQLIHAFQTTEAQHLFLQTFWQTMNREWTGIDRLRLDKFYMLMRMVLNESLKALKMQGWEERQAERLLELLTTEILHPDSQAPSGVKSHFLEIFLEELSKVGAAELTADQNLKFIEPFCTIAAQTKDSLVLHNITRGVFETIVEQAPFAIEDLMNELEAPEEEEGMSEDEWEEDVPSKEPRRGSLHGAAPDTSEEPAGDGEDSMGPVLQFDYEAVASRLFAAASQQDTPSQNRKRLYKVIRKLQDLAEGLFPEDDVPEKACRNLQEDRRERKTKKRLPKSAFQNKAGKGGEEDSCPDLSSGAERMARRQGSGAERTGPQEQPGGPVGRGARKRRRRRRPRAGARAKVTDCQDLRMRRRRPPRSGK
ncbi:ribosomal RNA processing protein 1 homolog A isoform X1 [Herpailurus yagouaroundi]|uniref:ribosomal RNA processing protein 1 homolog A isoform X1 n=1 Tax=Herpailurus yagouaroundi TaxID=1608482 RepID=UPI001AD7CB76|nr:ribosomal RNA processing protein 1 homolog A isoform X1 [Puma yagouaroundi]